MAVSQFRKPYSIREYEGKESSTPENAAIMREYMFTRLFSHVATSLVLGVLILCAIVPCGDCAEYVFFKVYEDKDCTKEMMKDNLANMTVSDACFVGSYIDPNGKNQTNANANFSCERDRIYWTQYPGVSTCSPPSGALCINATLSTSCEMVRTHMGTTYQKLVNFSGCSESYVGPRCP